MLTVRELVKWTVSALSREVVREGWKGFVLYIFLIWKGFKTKTVLWRRFGS